MSKSIAVSFFCTLAFNFLFTLNAQESSTEDLKELIDLQKSDLENYAIRFTALENAYQEGQLTKELLELYEFHTDFLFTKSQYDSAIKTLHLALKLEGKPRNYDLSTLYLDLSLNFHAKGDYDSLVFWVNRSEELINANDELYPQFLYVKSLKSSFEGNYDIAIKDLLLALDYFEQKNDQLALAMVYNSLAFDFGKLEDFKKQRAYLLKSIEVSVNNGYDYFLISNYNNLGSSYRQENLLDEALQSYSLAYDLLLQGDSPMLLAQNLTNRANIFEQLGDFEKAEELFLACRSLSETNQIRYGVMLSNVNLGNLNRLMGNYGKADSLLNASLFMAKEMKLKREVALCYERLAWLKRDVKDFEQAYAYLNSYYSLNDSLVNESVRNTANELREKYEAEKRDKLIISLKNEKLSHQYFMVLMAIGLVLLFFIFLWWRNKQKLIQAEIEIMEKLHQNQRLKLKQREKDLMEETMEKELLKEQLNELIRRNTLEERSSGKKSKASAVSESNSWNHIIEKFKLLHPEFIENLRANYPELTQNDLELCSLIKMNLTTKEIAKVLRITDQSVRTRKYRMLKKVGLTNKTDLSSWVNSIDAQD